MKRIGDALIDAGVISHQQLQEALSYMRPRGLRLGEALIEKGLISERDLLESLSDQLGIPTVLDEELIVEPSVVHEIPYVIARKYTVIPLEIKSGRLLVATFDPLNIGIIDDLESRAKKPVTLVLASSKRIIEAIDRYYSGSENISQTLKQVQDIEDEAFLSRMETEDLDVQDTPVVKFVNQVLQKAVRERASDIHIEIDNLDFHIRFRIDGMLQTMFRPKEHLHALIVSRLKVMARMDVSEHRLPQDGRIVMKIDDMMIDFRAATIPCVSGENIVIRVLNHGPAFKNLSELGMSKEGLDKVQDLISHSYGLLPIAGPTGSGKTTTLYSMLKQLNQDQNKIITLEDPVEMQLPMLNQMQVNPKLDLTFANGLRSILRMDPDVIMIGEIRDGETAKLAVNAAMTGHLVLTTIHTGSAAEIPVRLGEMGVEPYLVANTMIGAISQRLVRLNCDSCKENEELPQKIFGHFKPDFKSFKGTGCPACNNTGYRNRTCIDEALIVNSKLKKAILNSADSDDIMQLAVESGMKTMAQNGIQKVKEGLTSFAELARVLSVN
jgi:type IV pilus assembly protein PilB